MYESEHTRFIRKLIDTKPEVVTEQKKSRAYWWDKRPNELAEGVRMDKSKLAQPSYVYGSDQGGD